MNTQTRTLASAVLALCVATLLMCDHAYRTAAASNAPRKQQQIARWYGALLAALIGVGAILVARAIGRCLNPYLWHDARSFWTWGQMLWAHQDPYSRTEWVRFFDGHGTPPAIVLEDMNKGSAYPPPTQLLFAIVGWLPFHPAMLVWESLQLAALLITAWLLAKTIRSDRGVFAFPLALALLLLLPATWITFDQGQTNFLAFAAILLAWHDRARARTDSRGMGAWIACATITKPIYHVYWLFPVLKKRWRALMAGAAVIIVTTAASAWVLGGSRFLEYFLRSPVGRLDPMYYYIPPGNQSLLSTILRLDPSRLQRGVPLLDPIFLTLVGLVLAITVWLMWRAPNTDEGNEQAFLLMAPAALLIYPGTLIHYSVLLLFPLLTLWTRRTGPARAPLPFALIIGAIYGIMCLGRGDVSVVANVLVWLIMIVATLSTIRRQRA